MHASETRARNPPQLSCITPNSTSWGDFMTSHQPTELAVRNIPAAQPTRGIVPHQSAAAGLSP